MTSSLNQFVPSIYQQNFFDWVVNQNPESRNALIQAVAGSGKSTTLVEACKRISTSLRVLFVAFAKKNVDDLKPKMPANAEALTLNSIGNRAWLSFIGARYMDGFINGSINYQFIHEVIDQEDGALREDIKTILADRFKEAYGIGSDYKRYLHLLSGSFIEEVGEINRLVGLAKGCGLVPKRLLDATKYDFRILTEDTRPNWIDLIDTYDLPINLPDVAIEVARYVLFRSVENAKESIDYDSQLWLPIIHRATFPKYDWVLVDELQDLNGIQIVMVEELCGVKTRIVAVGDRCQAIYFWRGSLSNTMDYFKERFNACEFPLSICYRCAKNVVKHAKEIVPGIEYHEGQVDGAVLLANSYGPKIFTKTDVVVCRNTAPLVSLAYRLFRCKIPCRILGRDIEHGLVKLIKKCAGKHKDVAIMEERLGEYQKRETEKAKKSHNFSRLDNLNDKIEALRVFVHELPEGDRTIKRLIENINKVFKMDKLNQTQMLCLATAHKVKGGEWDHVFILEPGLMPSKRAQSEEAKQQEYNVMYVARTRAKKTLTYINLDAFNEKNIKAEIVSLNQEEVAA